MLRKPAVNEANLAINLLVHVHIRMIYIKYIGGYVSQAGKIASRVQIVYVPVRRGNSAYLEIMLFRIFHLIFYSNSACLLKRYRLLFYVCKLNEFDTSILNACLN